MVMLTEDEDKERIMAVCHEVLPKYWQPKEIIAVEKLPMTETGKPKRTASPPNSLTPNPSPKERGVITLKGELN